MLSDWYFCACIGATVSETEIRISLLQTLEDRRADAATLAVALGELRRADVWTRRYAVPRVVDVLCEGRLDPPGRAVARALLDEARDAAPASAEWERLVARLVDGATAPVLAPLLEACARSVSELEPVAAAAPYLDLPARSPVVLLLATALARSGDDGPIAALLSSPEPSAFATLVDAASRHEHGRLSFRLAVALLREHGEPGDVAWLQERLAACASFVLDLEPDLLGLIAEAHLARAEDPGESAVSECESLLEWRRLRRAAKPADEDVDVVLLRTCAEGPADDEQRPMRRRYASLALWQGTVWWTLAARHPERALPAFAEAYRRPYQWWARQLSFRAPVGRDAEKHAHQLEDLAWLQARPSASFVASAEAADPWPTDLRWLLASPWLRAEYETRGRRYPESTPVVSYLRLGAAVAACVRAIASRCPLGEPLPAEVAAFLLHAADVIAQSRRARARGAKEARTERDPIVSWLTTVAHRLERAATTLLDPEPLLASMGAARTDSSIDAKTFVRAAPEVMSHWIAYALGRAVPGRPEATWAAAADRVIAERPSGSVHESACLERFLYPARPASSFPEAHWKNADGWTEQPRRYFLRPALPPTEWDPAWTALAIREGEWNRPEQAAFAIALERVATLGPAPTSRRELDWLDEYRGKIATVPEPRQIDRFARLRLIELLDAPALVRDDRVFLLGLLLEIGQPIDLDRLAERVFAGPAGPGDPCVELRAVLAPALLERARRGMSEGDLHRDVPATVEWHEDRATTAEVLGRWLSRIAAPSNAALALAPALRARAEEIDLAAMIALRRRDFDIELRNGAESLLARAGTPSVDVQVVRRAIVDGEARRVTLLVEDWGSERALEIRQTDQELPGDQASLVGVTTGHRAEARAHEYRFDVGVAEVGMRTRSELGLAVGALACVWVRRGRAGWEIDPERPLPRPLRPRRIAGERALVRVTVALRGGEPELTATVDGQRLAVGRSTIAWFDPKEWLADASTFDGVACSTQVIGTLVGALQWSPAPRDALSLLLDLRPAAPSRWLTFLEARGGRRPAWGFGGGLGERFVLSPADFDAGARAELDRRLRAALDSGDALVAGARVHVGADRDGKLTLAGDAPFDFSLRSWSKLFSPGERRVAVLREAGWSIALEPDERVSGFPEFVPLQWAPRGAPGAGVGSVDVEVVGWDPAARHDPRHAAVVVTALEAESLRATDEALVRWFEAAPVGELVVLSSFVCVLAQEGANDGLVETSEGFRVRLRLDSLTLERLSHASGEGLQSELQRYVGRRQAIVERAFWRDSGGKAGPIAVARGGEQIPWGDEGEATGLVTRLPRRGGTIWQVLWKTRGGVVRSELELASVSPSWVRVGDRVEATIGPDGSVWLDTSARWVEVRAVYRLDQAEAIPSGETERHVLELFDERRVVGAIERAPGVLALLTDEPERARVEHGWLRAAGSPKDGARSMRQAALWESDSRRRLGWVRFDGSAARGLAARPQLHAFEVRCVARRVATDAWVVERWLENLYPIEPEEHGHDERAPATQLAQPARALLVAALEERLERVLHAGGVVDARWRGHDGVELIDLPLPRPERPSAPTWVRLVPGEAPFSGREGVGRVLLARVAGGTLFASFQRVPPLALVEWHASLGAPALDETFLLRLPLIYVGPETRDPATDDPHDEPRHRFEWLPGCMLLLRADELRIDGQRWREWLFHGDGVKEVTFRRIDEHLVLDVREAHIELAAATRLYAQAKDHAIVHVLRVQARNGSFTIRAVEGFDEADATRTLRGFAVPHATIAEDGRELILAALGDSESARVPVRLDLPRFEASRGRELVFHALRLVLGGPHGIREGERVFLEIDRVSTRGPNEVVATLRHAADWGDAVGVPEITVPRRAFSVREEVLRLVSRRGVGDQLRGQVVLAALHRRRSGVDGIEARLWDEDRFDSKGIGSLPCRRVGALRAWLVQRKEQVLVTVLGLDHDTLGLELRPGVFAAVRKADLAAALPREVRRGTVLRASLRPDGSIELGRGVPGDAQMVPSGGRSVSVLPLDSVKQRLPAGHTDDQFTVEGLPDLRATVGVFGPAGQWRSSPDEAFELLVQPPPRRAWLFQDEQGWCLDPRGPTDADPMVRLEPTDDEVRLCEIDGQRRAQAIPWRLVTFADRPRAEILARSQRAWWPHDAATLYCTRDGAFTRVPLPRRSGETGPLFAQHARPRLRYDDAARPRFAFPPRELTEALPSATEGRVSIAVVSAEQERLLVEVSPGRVVALTPAMMVLGGRSADVTRERTLTDLALDLFAVGDELEVSRAQADPLSIDGVRLHRWTPGARGLIGGPRAVLPVAEVDLVNGALVLGVGTLAFAVPCGDLELEGYRVGMNVAIDIDNTMSAVAPRDAGLRRGDRVLLEPFQGGLSIAGFPGLHFTSPADGPLAELLEADAYAFADLLGGAVPVRVVGFVGQIVRVERDDVAPSLSPDSVLQVELLGVSGSDEALVRAGRFALRVPRARLFAGVPATAFRHVVEALRGKRLWLRVDENGELLPGTDARSPMEGAFSHLQVVRSAAAPIGFIATCAVTRARHWLGIDAAGWIDLGVDDRAELFARENVAVRAVPGDHGALSVLERPQVRAELARLRVGDHVPIAIVHEEAETRRVARSLVSGAWLLDEGSRPAEEPGLARTARVSKIDVGLSRVFVAPLELATLRLEVPAGLGAALDAAVAGRPRPPVSETTEVSREIQEILELDELGAPADWERARRRLAELASRALRGWPLEILGAWLHDRRARDRSGPWRRLVRLEAVLRGEPTHGMPADEARAQLKLFCRAVELRQGLTDAELAPLAVAIRATLGDVAPASMSRLARAPRCETLVELSRLAPVAREALPNVVRERLRGVLEVAPFPLLLGPTLPPLA
jgi:hypothetical protein